MNTRSIDDPWGLNSQRVLDMQEMDPWDLVVHLRHIGYDERVRRRVRVRVPKPTPPPQPTTVDIPPPFCACGCGKRVRNRFGGIWAQWCVGHHMRGIGGYRGEVAEIA